MQRCPGMNPQNWKPDDVTESSCGKCGSKLEFWKDDVKKICRVCNTLTFNPNLKNTCLSWCDKAEECIGNSDIAEWKKNMLHCKS